MHNIPTWALWAFSEAHIFAFVPRRSKNFHPNCTGWKICSTKFPSLLKLLIWPDLSMVKHTEPHWYCRLVTLKLSITCVFVPVRINCFLFSSFFFYNQSWQCEIWSRQSGPKKEWSKCVEPNHNMPLGVNWLCEILCVVTRLFQEVFFLFNITLTF